MDKTLIIHSITRLYLGGAQKICFDITKYLNRNNYNVLVITGKREEMTKDFIDENISLLTIDEFVRAINPIKDIIAFIKIIKSLKILQMRYGRIIIHTHTSKAGILTRWAAYLCGIKDIYHTAHGWAFYKGQNTIKRNVFIIVEQLTALITKKIIAVSQTVKMDGLLVNIGVRSKYRVIYNAIEKIATNKKRNEIKEKLHIPKNKRIVLQVSCLKKQKDPLTFIKIVEYIKNDNFYFIIAGDGSLLEEMKKYTQKHNLHNILITGWYHNIDELYSISSICILTSLFEGMPLTLLEASVYNLPIIATNIENHREFLHNNYLCSIGDYRCFAKKIEKYSQTNRNLKFECNYNSMLKEYEALYNKKCENNLQNAKIIY